MVKGKIFNIQKTCTNDGPGIRTTVFFKGCPLKCLWCHNPESHEYQNTIMFAKEKCMKCGRCVSRCNQKAHSIENGEHNFDRTKCLRCGECLNATCDALYLEGRTVSVGEVINEVMKDKPFYDSTGGGLTVSGGEPLWQMDFLLSLLKEAKENKLHVCVETCGYAKSEDVVKLLPYVDVFLFDYKETNAEKHKRFTGVDNVEILKNLQILDDAGKSIILRCPIIHNYNDTQEHFYGIAQTANKFKNIMQVEIEPYHSFGENKYEKMGKNYELVDTFMPTKENIDEWIGKIKAYTSKVVKQA